MSSGGGGTTTTQFQGPPQYIQDYGRDFLGRAAGVSQLPYESYQGQRVSDLSPTQRGAIGNLGGLANGTALTDDASGMLSETLRGGGMNPYASGVADRITGDASRAYYNATGQNLARFRGANRNSSGFEQAQQQTDESFARGLTDGLAPVYQSGYENERNRQMQAVPAAMGIFSGLGNANMNALQAGGVETNQYQNMLDADYGDFREWRDYPQQQLGIFGNALSQAMGAGGSTSTTQGPGPDRVSQGLGTMALGRLLSSGKG